MIAIQVSETGGPEVLEQVELPDPDPGSGRVLVEVAAAGVNFIDTYQRGGLYPMELPFIVGQEGAGRVVAVGEGVQEVEVGDVVAWTDVQGSYATTASIPWERTIRVPDGIDAETAAAAMLQGSTAEYLATSTFPLQPGHRCLIHAGAGGVGRLLIQIAKVRGAEVFTTVGSPEKVEVARSAGADHVIDYRAQSFVEAIEALAGPRPLDVIYDGVGAATFEAGLGLLKPRGTMVTFGNASGPVDPIAPLALMRAGSLYLTRPTLGDYIRDRAEFKGRAERLFGWIADGSVEVHIGGRYPLQEAAEAHRALEGRATTGKLLLIP